MISGLEYYGQYPTNPCIANSNYPIRIETRFEGDCLSSRTYFDSTIEIQF